MKRWWIKYFVLVVLFVLISILLSGGGFGGIYLWFHYVLPAFGVLALIFVGYDIFISFKNKRRSSSE